MIIELDCAAMTSRAAAHEYLKQQFSFPEYYGKNLDALFDLLSTEKRELTVSIINQEQLEHLLGGYGDMLLATIREASEDNPNLVLTDALMG